ncbi:MAG: creatininase family protein [Gemmatimonadetes bacterium]|nr:creatininase family protein [Gemmatimonadota bacterium]
MPPLRPFSLLCLLATPLAAQTPGAFLGDLNWPDAEVRIRQAPLVVVPFGAGAKEHGPHLPMNADAVVMEYLCRITVDSLPVLVAPPILHGWFPAFREFPGTEIAEPDVFRAYVQAVAMSLVEQGARRIVFLNTGISHATGLPISIVARDIRANSGIPTLVLSWDDLEPPEMATLTTQRRGGHADEIETSIHLYLQPRLVRMDRAVAAEQNVPPKAYPGYEPGFYARDPKDPAYSTTGLTGDPTLATAEKGKRALDLLAREWLKALRGFGRM